MTSKELNQLLVTHFPELKKDYESEIAWQDGDDTGSHIVYGDILYPYMVYLISTKNNMELKKVFNFIETVLSCDDSYASEVISLSLLEGFDHILFETPEIFELLGSNTKKEIRQRNGEQGEG